MASTLCPYAEDLTAAADVRQVAIVRAAASPTFTVYPNGRLVQHSAVSGPVTVASAGGIELDPTAISSVGRLVAWVTSEFGPVEVSSELGHTEEISLRAATLVRAWGHR